MTMIYSHYPHGFVNGVAIREQVVANIYSGKANVFWVDSNVGTDGNKGTFQRPFATVNFAISQCKANNGDIIMVAEGHKETLTTAAAIAINVAGIVIAGVGTGNNRPTFTFATATSATITVTAADVYLYNLHFICNIASQVTMLAVTGKRCIIDSCRFAEGSATGLNMLTLGSSANDSDGARIINSEFYTITNGNYLSAINLNAVADGTQIRNNFILGYCANGDIYNPTATVLTDLYIADNSVRNLGSAKAAINIVSASTGRLENNDLYADAFATTLVAGSLFCAGNLASNGAGQGSVPIPTPPNNPQTFTGAGSVFVINKTFTSSAITTAAVDMTSVSAGGDLVIENAVFKTGSTGLATGTNFQLISNNADGAPIIMAETVANLGANKTVDLFSASIAKQRTVLESGKKFQIQMTGSNGTGSGTVDVYITLRRVAAGATVATL